MVVKQINWPKPVLLVVVGLTASGKSEFAYNMALQLNGEIVNGDSVNMRKYLNIGADKPPAEYLKNVKHHLVDFLDLEENFNVQRYKLLAQQTIRDIQNKNRLPILVGGSNLYIDSVVYNYSFQTMDNTLNLDLETLSLDSLIKIAKKLELPLNKIDYHNKTRLISFIKRNGNEGSKLESIPNNVLIVGINFDYQLLKEKIILRVDAMFDNGLEEEVKKVKSLIDHKTLNIIGYKEWDDYLLGLEDIEQVKHRIINNTYHLMKKQRTWLKKNKDIKWINLSSKMDDIIELITINLNK